MKKDIRLRKIRESERKSHIEIYSNAELYQEGSWLKKPIKTVLDIIPLFDGYKELRVLDLGCGVGRNCIPIAQHYGSISCIVECVDILELAIEKLRINAQEHGVLPAIKDMVMPIEEYSIKADTYDLIMAISALEHVDSKESFIQKLEEICKGILKGGIVCLVINSEVSEHDKVTGATLDPQFEVNLSTEGLQQVLGEIFADWQILKFTVRDQQYDIPRENGLSDLKTNVVTFVARRH